MKVLTQFCRVFVGILFIFSGLIKLNDPVGFSFKLDEYFSESVFNMPFLQDFSLTLAVVLVIAEVLLGVMLLLGYMRKLTLWLLMLMIVFFTFLTFYSAYFNKVTDCGCFGDAIQLTPWQSFYKDIFLLALIAVLFINRKSLDNNQTLWVQSVVALTLIGSLALSIAAIRNLPFIDFRAYKEGVHIPTAMQPSAQLEYSYLMMKDGEEVVLDQYPNDDSYEFVDMQLKNPEALPKISDFAIWNEEGDFTAEVLSGNKLLILVSDISKMSEKNLGQISELLSGLNRTEITPVFVAASSEEIGRAHV